MKSVRLIISFGIVFSFSCKPPKQANESPSKPAVETSTAKEAATINNNASDVSINKDQPMQITKDTRYRLIVSFISIGEGTDRNGKELLDSFLNDWATKHKREVGYETVQWGREGEVDFCFLLSEMNDVVLQQEFVRGIKEKFKGHSLVQFTENEPCLHKR